MLAARRLALGTAQLGQRYGIANRSGQPNLQEARDIVQSARLAGMDTIDTAVTYGTSESVLGTVGVCDLRIVTKLPPLPAEEADVGAWTRARVSESLQRLGVPRLQALLLHRPGDVLESRGTELVAALQALREDGLVVKLGVSIYDPTELEQLVRVMELGLVQAPYNVLDRRLSASGWLERLHGRGVEVHARSAFLQGLLLIEEAQLPAAFARWLPVLTRWWAWLRDNQLSPLQAALGFVLRSDAIDRVIVGVESAAQLREIAGGVTALERDVPWDLACNDLDLIDPSKWKRN